MYRLGRLFWHKMYFVKKYFSAKIIYWFAILKLVQKTFFGV
jgi:hypothetical protein